MMRSQAEMLLEGQQLVRVLDRALAETAREFGMNKTELGVLMFLSDNPDKNIAKNIVECMRLTKSCVSKAIDSLVKDGYLTVQEDGKDRRILHLTMQEKAGESVKAGEAAQRQAVIQIMDGISEEEQEIYLKICQQMLENCKKIL